ncbi:MAG: hydrogenase maturation protease [Gemmatimonadetes bacterium]|uniref:Hydrogenase maturation protease n=1 Tax=Candidatus Kutchimonas denitrificans TaxID=3056748 RepID=A0AAE4ZBV6_9BACT|nr:hydrogenase maturation protease [Gemmatimonadota bacterium]NIR76392.1 hydrogenase maturation protease [Candidatus Kutchimonas denitrificans]NIS03202.1 hydrogenase maturation protease [Gemmatimonadota bacterium]NIT66375.1 hydrogenase maturation protease [Gemmatimonadota bacterium]NIU54454.1 hydrogenase maturation protease [Gemmatimonadota bacterium]
MVTRVLCLGNELLADDAFGALVAGRLAAWTTPDVDVVFTANTGFSLIDLLLDVDRLIVVDAISTGSARPGTVRAVREGDVAEVSGGSPHYIGLFEALALARALEMPAAREMAILVVEAADCFTVGGAMHPAVSAAVPKVVALVKEMLAATDLSAVVGS